MHLEGKPLVWLHGKVKSPPFSQTARIEAGYLLRLLQGEERLSMPQSRPMPSIGKSCHELRVVDSNETWRIIYRIDRDAIIILHVFKKKTEKTQKSVINICKSRIIQYDKLIKKKQNE